MKQPMLPVCLHALEILVGTNLGGGERRQLGHFPNNAPLTIGIHGLSALRGFSPEEASTVPLAWYNAILPESDGRKK